MLRFLFVTLGLALASGCSCSTSHAPAEDAGMDPPDASGPDGGAVEDGGGDIDAGGPGDAGPSGRVTGEACSRPDQCEAAPVAGTPQCFPGPFGWPGGYCTNEGCNPSLDGCPGDGVCELGGGGGSVCLDACDPAASDCRPGYNCFDASLVLGGATRHYCLPLCADDSDCDAGETCDDAGSEPTRRCYSPGAAIGDPCEGVGDCGIDQFCLSEEPFGLPAGYCTESCNPMMTGECGGGLCIETDAPDEGLCLEGCAATGDCRSGYGCLDVFPPATMLPSTACVPDCGSAGDCTVAGRSCESVVGLCQPTLDPAAFGGPCASNEDCLGGFCLREIEDGAPHGYCVDECEPGGTLAGDCPSTGTCVDLGPAAPLGICLTSCDPMSPACRVGYVCPSFGPVTDVCIPDCSASDQCESMCCAIGTGGLATGECVDPSGTPPPTCLP